jgi:tryptophan synthase alpha chain
MSKQIAVGALAISDAITKASQQGQPALVAFLTAGFPSKATFLSDLARISEVADVVEIGVPFTDPLADGLTIQRSSQQALLNGVTLQWILQTLKNNPQRPKAPLLLMSYLNPLLAFGLDKLPLAMRDAGVSGVIVPDLPLEESNELKAALNSQGMALVQLVSPVTPAERLARVVLASQGFVYAVTLTGTTGKQAAKPGELSDYLTNIRAIATVPVCAGFGIREAGQVRALANLVEGVIIGSALVDVLERGADPVAFLQALRA